MENSKADHLRQLVSAPEVLIVPGGFSPLMARMCQVIGYGTFFMAGSHTSAHVWGLPDVGLLTMREMADHARRCADACSIPVIADADTGYGNALNVFRTVREYVHTGVAGLTIEDQEEPKKGVGARACISVKEAVGKYRAARAACEDLGGDVVVIARCDFIGSEGGSFEGAVERCIQYAEEGKADLVWLTQIPTMEQVQEACRQIPAPVMPGYAGRGPFPSIQEWQQAGAAAVLYRTLTTGAAVQAAWDFLNDFKERGTEAEREWAARARESKWGVVSNDSLVSMNREKVASIENEFLPPM